jgi:hypothetical protein
MLSCNLKDNGRWAIAKIKFDWFNWFYWLDWFGEAAGAAFLKLRPLGYTGQLALCNSVPK